MMHGRAGHHPALKGLAADAPSWRMRRPSDRDARAQSAIATGPQPA